MEPAVRVMEPFVRLIPASLQMHSSKSVQLTGKRRTAAYARVSTDSEEQQTSYAAQVDYYSKYIRERDDWEFAGVYTDEGISAVSTKNRDGFNQMVSDALLGKIDTKYRKVIWRCNNKYKREEKCSTPHVTEEEVRRKFVAAFNSVLAWRKELIDNCQLAQKTLCDCSGLDAEIAALGQEIEVLKTLTRGAILTAAGANSAEESAPVQIGAYVRKHDDALKHMKELEGFRREKQNKKTLMDTFIQNIQDRGECLDAFDERLWAAVTESVTVMPYGALVFRFKDGTDITIGED